MLVKIMGYLILKELAVVDNFYPPLRLWILDDQENSCRNFSEQVGQSQFVMLQLMAQKSETHRTIQLVMRWGSLETSIPHI